MATPSPTRVEVERLWWITGVLLLGLLVAVDVLLGRQINGAYAGAAVLTAVNAERAPHRRCRRPAILVRRSPPACGTTTSAGATGRSASPCVLICGLAVMAAT